MFECALLTQARLNQLPVLISFIKEQELLQVSYVAIGNEENKGSGGQVSVSLRQALYASLLSH